MKVEKKKRMIDVHLIAEDFITICIFINGLHPIESNRMANFKRKLMRFC